MGGVLQYGVMKYSYAILAGLLIFLSGIFSVPGDAKAAPCDIRVDSKVNILGTGSTQQRSIGAGSTKFHLGPVAPYLLEDIFAINEDHFVANSYDCSGPVTPLPQSTNSERYSVSYVLPSGLFLSANKSSRISSGINHIVERGPSRYTYNGGSSFDLPLHCGMEGNIYAKKLYEVVPDFCGAIDSFYDSNPSIHEYVVDPVLKAPWFDDSGGVSQIKKEDEAIDQIAKTGNITVKSGDGVTLNIPATNCVRIAGPDPDEYSKSHGGKQPIKVVFMRDTSIDSSTAGKFAELTNYIINNGFQKVYPYSEYYNDFVFYVDLQKRDEPLIEGGRIFTNLPNSYISSSCSVSGNDKQIFFFDRGTVLEDGYTFQGGKIVFINVSRAYDQVYTVLHEISHAIGNLNDEYILGTSGKVATTIDGMTRYETTCSTKPRWDYRGPDNIIYGSVVARGCGYLKTIEMKNPQDYFRPSDSSLMHLSGMYDMRFNVVSCGYLIAGFKGESLTQSSAQKYWPECLEAAKAGKVIKDGIPPVAPAPTIYPPKTGFLQQTPSFANIFDAVKNLFENAVTIPTAFSAGVYSASPGFAVKVSGSGFTPTGNAAQLRNVATGVISEILDISTVASNSLTFTVPTTTPSGEYMMKVGAFNSPWSNELSFSVLARKIPTVTISANPVTVKSGQSTTVIWTSNGADSCKGTANASVPGSWSNPDLKGTITFVPTGNTTLTLTCTGIGGSKSAQVQILSDVVSKPTISFSATPSNISTGNGTTLSWTSYNATSCTGASTSALPVWSKSQATSGSIYVIPSETSTLTLTCAGTAGEASATQSVIVSNTNNLVVSCSAYPATTVGVHQLVTRTAVPTGGTGSYTYLWAGAESLTGTNKSISTYYTTTGSKTAQVTISSGGQSATAQCTPVSVNPSFGPINKYTPTITSISPVSGRLSTKITVSGYGFTEGTTAIVVKKGTDKVYIKPDTIYGDPASTLTFDLSDASSLPAPQVGDVYKISIISRTGKMGYNIYPYTSILESAAISFTITSTGTTIPVVAPVLTNVTPATGQTPTPAIISGSGFSTGNLVIVRQGNYVETITPTAVSPTSLSFVLSAGSIITGDLMLSVSNQGVASNELKFTLSGTPLPRPLPPPRVPTPRPVVVPPATTTPATPPPISYTMSVIPRISGRTLTSSEANGCVSTVKNVKTGTTDTAGCVRSFTNQPVGTSYQVSWTTGYPSGADTTKKPTVTPAYPQTLGERPVGINPAIFYIDFVAAPVVSQAPTLQNLTATTTPGASYIDLFWSNPSGLTGDIVPEQSELGAWGSWSMWKPSSTEGCDKDMCTITGLPANVIYKFRARIYNSVSGSYSTYSNETAPVMMWRLSSFISPGSTKASLWDAVRSWFGF